MVDADVPIVLHSVDNFFPQPTELSTDVDNLFELSTSDLRKTHFRLLFTKLSTGVDNFTVVLAFLESFSVRPIHSCGITCV